MEGDCRGGGGGEEGTAGQEAPRGETPVPGTKEEAEGIFGWTEGEGGGGGTDAVGEGGEGQ